MKKYDKSRKEKEDTSISTSRENLMILLLINEGQNVYQKIKDEISPKDFKNEANRDIAQILYNQLEKGELSNVIGLFERQESLLSHITYILSKEIELSDVDKAIEDIKDKFIKEKFQEEKAEILKKLVSNDLDKEEAKALEVRLKEISKKLVNLK